MFSAFTAFLFWFYSIIKEESMRRVCSYCKLEMEPTDDKPLEDTTHGICPECFKIKMEEIDNLKGGEDGISK